MSDLQHGLNLIKSIIVKVQNKIATFFMEFGGN